MSIINSIANSIGNIKPPRNPERTLKTIGKIIANVAPKLDLNRNGIVTAGEIIRKIVCRG